MKKDEGKGLGGWDVVLPWAIGGAVLASYMALVCTSYFILSSSDPHNWLVFARNFAEEFGKSRWPYGYPLYLKGVMAVVGPYWVYLANLPSILGMFLLTGWLGTMFAAEDGRAEAEGRDGERTMPRSWGFLAVLVVVMGADTANQMNYLNPFRDPPSYLLLLASVGVFVRSLASRRTWGVWIAGALLGLASSIREPSVLMLVPLFAYGLLAWRKGEGEPGLCRNVVAFALGLAVGVAPMLVQSYLSTHQVLIPHNMLLSGPRPEQLSRSIPGMFFDGSRFALVGGDALKHYLETEPLLLLLALAGLVAAVRHGNRLVLAVIVPAAFGYALFYSFYRAFFQRYFYVALLFFAMLAGYGLFSMLRLLLARGRTPAAGRTAGWCLLAAMACVTSFRLLSVRAPVQPHQIPQARAMAAVMRELCPDADVIYAARPLCEWIDWFLECESHPFDSAITSNIRAEIPDDASDLRNVFPPRLARGEKLYTTFWSKGVQEEMDAPDVRRVVDRCFVGSFDPTLYGAGSFLLGAVTVHRLEPWTNRTVNLSWPVPERGEYGGSYWFMADMGDWIDSHAPATVSVDEASGPPPVIPHGGAWVGGAVADEAAAGRTVGCSIASTDLLPRVIPVCTGPLDEPLVLDFRPYYKFDHLWRWKGDIRLPSEPRLHLGVGIRSGADFELPVPWPELADTVLALELVSDRVAPGVSIPVVLSEDGRPLARTEVPGDRSRTRLPVPLAYVPGGEARHLHLEVEAQDPPESDSDPTPIGIECVKATIVRWPVACSARIQVGDPSDDRHVLSGFSRREKGVNSPIRWTTGPAELAVFLPPGKGKFVLRIACGLQGMPAKIMPPDGPSLRVTCDGIEVPGTLEEVREGGGDYVWQGVLPTEEGRTPHRIGIDAPTWRPREHGVPDTRTLGVRIGTIELALAE